MVSVEAKTDWIKATTITAATTVVECERRRWRVVSLLVRNPIGILLFPHSGFLGSYWNSSSFVGVVGNSRASSKILKDPMAFVFCFVFVFYRSATFNWIFILRWTLGFFSKPKQWDSSVLFLRCLNTVSRFFCNSLKSRNNGNGNNNNFLALARYSSRFVKIVLVLSWEGLWYWPKVHSGVFQDALRFIEILTEFISIAAVEWAESVKPFYQRLRTSSWYHCRVQVLRVLLERYCRIGTEESIVP